MQFKFVVIIALCLLTSCASVLERFIEKKEHRETIQYKVDEQLLANAIKENRILEGMNQDMVVQSWGQPVTQKSENTGFVIWEYKRAELFFIDNILITWQPKAEN